MQKLRAPEQESDGESKQKRDEAARACSQSSLKMCERAERQREKSEGEKTELHAQPGRNSSGCRSQHDSDTHEEKTPNSQRDRVGKKRDDTEKKQRAKWKVLRETERT